MLEMESTGKSKEEMAIFGLGKMKQAFKDGDVVNGSVMAGQISGMINDIPAVEKIVEGVFSGVVKELERCAEIFR